MANLRPSFTKNLRSILHIKLGSLQQGTKYYKLTPPPTIRLEKFPRISIITPSYNHGNFITQTVRSVLSQNYPNLDYIIQDNCSTDNTINNLKKMNTSEYKLFVEKDRGQADALNKGFARSTGEIMGFLNSDDILLPGALAQIAMIFQENPHIDAIYGNRILIDSQDNIVGRWVLPYHDGELLRHIDYVPQETLFWRRSLWERCGCSLNEKLDFALDWELLLRFLEANARFFHVPQFLGAFRIHPKQKTNSEILTNGVREMKWLRRRYAPNPISKIWMPARHFIFLLKHINADRKFSSSLEAIDV